MPCLLCTTATSSRLFRHRKPGKPASNQEQKQLSVITDVRHVAVWMPPLSCQNAHAVIQELGRMASRLLTTPVSFPFPLRSAPARRVGDRDPTVRAASCDAPGAEDAALRREGAGCCRRAMSRLGSVLAQGSGGGLLRATDSLPLLPTLP